MIKKTKIIRIQQWAFFRKGLFTQTPLLQSLKKAHEYLNTKEVKSKLQEKKQPSCKICKVQLEYLLPSRLTQIHVITSSIKPQNQSNIKEQWDKQCNNE